MKFRDSKGRLCKISRRFLPFVKLVRYIPPPSPPLANDLANVSTLSTFQHPQTPRYDIKDTGNVNVGGCEFTNSKKSYCEICFKPFSQEYHAKGHVYTHMSWDELEETDIFHEDCEFCGKVFLNGASYMKHIKIHVPVPSKLQEALDFDRDLFAQEESQPPSPPEDDNNNENNALQIQSKDSQPAPSTEPGKGRIIQQEPSTPGIKGAKISKGHFCYFCKKMFQSASILQKHYAIHTKEMPSSSSLSPKLFNNDRTLRSCVTRHERVHIKTLQSKRRTGNFCYFCHKNFRFPSGLSRHLALHTKEDPSTCSQSKKDLKELKRHGKTNGRFSRTLFCYFCDKNFQSLYDLNCHLALHTKENLKFLTCRKNFVREGYFTRYRKAHGGELPVPTKFTQNVTNPKKESGLFKCPQCSKQFTRIDGMRRHNKTHGADGGRNVQCSYCPLRFTEKHHKIRHEKKIHAGPHFCYFCDKKFPRLFNLDRHLSIHTIEAPFKCRWCGIEFSQKYKLSRHEKIHGAYGGRSRRFQCSYCPLRFTKTYNKIRHEKRIHVRIPQEELMGLHFFCYFCDKNFRYLYDLDRHLAIHTKETPFKCRWCIKEFSQKYKLSKHEKTHSVAETDAVKRSKLL